MNRSLSSKTLDLIAQIYRRRGLWERLTLCESGVLLVQLVAAQEEPLAARHLLPLVFATDDDLAEAAADAVHYLIGCVAPRDLPWFDECVRDAWYEGISAQSSRSEIRPGDLVRLAAFPHRSVSLLGLASLHRNGFVRQRAVELLAGVTTGRELSFLLLRLNDWVESVRVLARAAVWSRLTTEYAAHFAQNLSLVTRLQRAGRSQHETVIGGVVAILTAPSGRAALYDVIRSPDRFERRFAYELLSRGAGDETAGLLRSALHDYDPTIRRWAIDRAGEHSRGSSRHRLFVLGLDDSVAGVRSHALSRLYRDFPEQAAEQAREAVLDTSATMRQQARFILRQAGPVDFATLYRAELNRKRPARVWQGALLGLGETGDAGDAALVRTFLTNPVPRVRRAALWALGNLAGTDHVPVFLQTLHDPSPRVSRQAAENLAAQLHMLEPQTLRRALQENGQRHLKHNVLRLIARLRKWDSLPLLLQAVDDPDGEVGNLASAYLRRWLNQFNRSLSEPSPAQRTSLRALLESRRFVLGRELYRELEFYSRE